jgi:hypothetical protein
MRNAKREEHLRTARANFRFNLFQPETEQLPVGRSHSAITTLKLESAVRDELPLNQDVPLPQSNFVALVYFATPSLSEHTASNGSKTGEQKLQRIWKEAAAA